MTLTSTKPGLLIDYHTRRREADALIDAGHYDRVAELLLKFQTESEKQGDASLAQMLNATRRICHACQQCRTQTEWHKQAYLETREREQELQRELETILDSIGGLKDTDGASNPPAADGAALAKADCDTEQSTFSARAVALLRRLQTLLWNGSGLRARRRAPPAMPMNGTAEPGQEDNWSRPAPVPPFECQSVRSTAPEITLRRDRPNSSTLLVYCLGPFQVYQDDHAIENWPNGKGKSIFKYLVTHRDRPIGKEVLMDLFWPNAEAPAARNNLNVAIYGLRQAISKANPCQSHVLFRDDCYLLNPDLDIWADYEEFTRNIRQARALDEDGQQSLAMSYYRTAEALYQGEFLEEDRYEDWLMPLRQSLQDDYLCLLDRLYRYHFDQQSFDVCTTVCSKMLAIDRCHERAHRRLMRCYSKQGQPYLALRQFQSCKSALARELDVMPSNPTLELYQKIRHQQPL